MAVRSTSGRTKPTVGPRRRYAPRLPAEQRREQLLDAALKVIAEKGYEGISVEAVSREAGVTRPVVYDHFPNLAQLLQALIAREERYSLGQLSEVVPQPPDPGNPVNLLAAGVRRFLEAVSARPATWRLILLPLDGTPAIVRDHVNSNRAMILSRIERLVKWSVERGQLPSDLDAELSARAIRDLAEEAGRMVLTDPQHYSPERYARFVESVIDLLGPRPAASRRR